MLLPFLPRFTFHTTANKFQPDTSFDISVLERLETCTGINIFREVALKCHELIGHIWLQPQWAHQSWLTLSPTERGKKVLEQWLDSRANILRLPATWGMLFRVLRDLELGELAQQIEDWLRMVPRKAVAGPEHSREVVEGEGRLEQTEGGVEEVGGAEGQEQEGGSEEDTKPGAGVKEEGCVAKLEGGAEKEPLKMKQEKDLVEAVRMLEERVAKREEQLLQCEDTIKLFKERVAKREEQLLHCEDTIQMYKERLQKQLQQMESVMAENEQLRKQIRPVEEGALVPAGERTAAGMSVPVAGRYMQYYVAICLKM